MSLHCVEGARVAAAQAGDRAALDAVLLEHLPRIRRTLSYYGVREGELDDRTQEVLIRIAQGLGDFRGDSALSTWIHRICLREAQACRRNPRRLVPLTEAAEPSTGPTSLDAWVKLGEVRDVLSRLPAERRIVLLMHDVEGYTGTEISTQLEVPEGTVHSRLRVARLQLRRAFQWIGVGVTLALGFTAAGTAAGTVVAWTFEWLGPVAGPERAAPAASFFSRPAPVEIELVPPRPSPKPATSLPIESPPPLLETPPTPVKRDAPTLFRDAREALEQGRLEEATVLLELLIALYPDVELGALVRFEEGLELRLRDPQAAQTALSEAIALDPDGPIAADAQRWLCELSPRRCRDSP